jgi:hypothetical protein
VVRLDAPCSVLLLAAATAGCQASVNAEANLRTGSETDETKELGDERSDLSKLNLPESDADGALFGARHDLKLSESAEARCKCLAVAFGGTREPAFVWHGEPPTINPETQVVIALRSRGIPCDAVSEDGLGASYWGYRQSGADTVVVLEEAKAGRPITSGAIVPRPSGSGRLVVAPLSSSLPYGRGLDGGAECVLIGPGSGSASE